MAFSLRFRRGQMAVSRETALSTRFLDRALIRISETFFISLFTPKSSGRAAASMVEESLHQTLTVRSTLVNPSHSLQSGHRLKSGKVPYFVGWVCNIARRMPILDLNLKPVVEFLARVPNRVLDYILGQSQSYRDVRAPASNGKIQPERE